VRSNSPCEFVTWEHFYALARKLALAIHDAGFEPEVMVAISRGGCIPARVVCDYLDVFDLDFVKVEHYHGTRKEKLARLRYPLSADITGKRVLLLDDVSDTGDSFEIAIKHLLANGEPAELKTAVLHHKTVSSYTPDFYADIVEEWRWIIYPWAVMEDLRSILQDMDSPPTTAEDLAHYLKQKHDLDLPRQSLEDVLSIPINARESL
jgi:hypoxanthine phosphoribosyltransferase